VVTGFTQPDSSHISFNYSNPGTTGYGGVILVLGSDTNGDGKLETFYNLPTGGMVFQVTGGVSRLR